MILELSKMKLLLIALAAPSMAAAFSATLSGIRASIPRTHHVIMQTYAEYMAQKLGGVPQPTTPFAGYELYMASRNSASAPAEVVPEPIVPEPAAPLSGYQAYMATRDGAPAVQAAPQSIVSDTAGPAVCACAPCEKTCRCDPNSSREYKFV